jgi:flagella basal body P-ring formation protein FlgA
MPLRVWCVAMLCACATVLAGADATLHIRATVQVASARATIADVAEIEADADVRDRLAGIVVAELPTLTPVMVDARLLVALATKAAAPANLRIVGSGQVARRTRLFSSDELLAAATATLPGGARAALVRAGTALAVPDSVELRLAAEPIDPTAVGEVPYRVRAMEGDRELGRTLVVLRIERVIGIVVALHDIAQGALIGPQDLRVEQRIAERSNLAAAVDPAVLAGSLARRAIKAGDPVSPQLTSKPPAVRAGAIVAVVWQGDGFAVELQATALGDAKAGERLGLRRVGDGALLRGIAQTDGTVLAER